MTDEQAERQEAYYLAIVERVQQAMAITPFMPNAADVVWLLAEWRRLDGRVRQLEQRETSA